MTVPADWEFSNARWELYTGSYKSAPTSLRERPLHGTYHRGWCKKTGLLNAEVGRIVDWFKSQDYVYSPALLIFRCQTEAGDTTPAHWMEAQFWRTNTKLYRYISQTPTLLATLAHGLALTANAWYKFRLTWWNAYDLQNNPTLAMEVEYWSGSAWISKGVAYDTYNLGLGSEKNRVGVGGFNNAGQDTYDTCHDDTEIWTPVP